MMINNNSKLEVYNLYEDVGGLRLGVIHSPITKLGFSFNINNMRQIIRYAIRMGIKTLILPPFLPYGVFQDIRKDILESTCINRKNPYVRILKHLASLNSSYMISPYVVEKYRSTYHISNLLIDGETGISRFFSRKIILSENEKQANIKPGSSIDVVSDLYLKYSVLLDDDVLIVEFSRLMSYMGVDVLITAVKQLSRNLDLVNVIKALQLFTGLTIIHVGYIIEDNAGVVASNPSVLVLPNGSIHIYKENNPALITIPLKVIRELRKPIDLEKVRGVLEITTQLLRRIHKY
ncbi:MAG: hypothetical protein QXT75_04025 [Desulfurococcaceae archaeon]